MAVGTVLVMMEGAAMAMVGSSGPGSSLSPFETLAGGMGSWSRSGGVAEDCSCFDWGHTAGSL